MRSTTHRFSLSLLIVAAVIVLPFIVGASRDEHHHARLITTARSIEWHPAADAGASMLSIQRPDGTVVSERYAAGSNPLLQTEGLADGSYAYELRITQADADMLVQSGSFAIANGLIVSPDKLEPNAVTTRKPSLPASDTLFTALVSATGGLCGGSDCTNSESFGLANIKMKANNTRLKFEDTSTSVGFPATDWQLSANDTFSGGLNKLFVEDLTAGTTPFTIEGGTPSNTLYVDSTGRVGIGTSTPGRNLQIADPISVIIRMEQSASPFQNWEMVGNNNNWYVRDVNHESNPFIIKSNASGNSIVIDTAGKIGMGVLNPAYQIDHSSGARLDAGNWVNASSRALKQDIRQLDESAAMDALKGLQPVTFEYKANPAETNVGFIAEDVPDLVATKDRKGLSAMDVVAVLTKVVQEQQRTIENLQGRLQKLEQK